MRPTGRKISRRGWMASTAGAAAGVGLERAAARGAEPAATAGKALIAITLDLEMAMHYPQWGITEWNFEKGNLTEPVKQYTVEACRRVKAKGGVVQCFVLGRTFEQAHVDWLKQIVRDGHPVGNHTYDHVNVWATKADDLQYRFSRAPWLIGSKKPAEVIRENIRLTDQAMQTRLGVRPVGFRTPGGSAAGLHGRTDVQKLLLECGFTWVSSLAASVNVRPENPTDADFAAVVKAQAANQPFIYPTGLVEIPMSPLGDIASFRRKPKWKLGDFLKMIEANVRWAIEHRAVFDLLSHPSVMSCEDPKFRAYELICDLVQQSNGRAAIVGLDAIAKRVQANRPN